MFKFIIEMVCNIYSIDNWSEGYFDINDQGEVDVGISLCIVWVLLQVIVVVVR